MEEKMSLAELNSHLEDAKARAKDIAAQFNDRDFPEDVEVEWEALKSEIRQTEERIAKREARERDLEVLSEKVENTESETKYSRKRNVSRIPDDPTNLDEYRVRARSLDDLHQLQRDGARKITENFRSAVPGVSKEEAQNDVDRLIGIDQEIAMRMIATSTPGYKREWKTYLATGSAGPEMQRAASLTTTAGGYAVPVELDTTLLLTNAGVVNPVRQIARVRQTNVNTVEFLNTAGITASYGAEATEASDNAPTVAQPTVNIEKAQAFVPFSIEIGQDWAAIQEDMAMAFADAKNQLESLKFLKGLGHASHEPQGLIAVGGATAIQTTAATATFAVGDLYALELALSPRYRPNATVVGNRATFQKIRQFATALGPSAWTDSLRDGNPNQIIGYPAQEWSSYDSTPTTSGSTILTIGDFRYFAIVDRAGMNVELAPLLFGASNRFPTGQRGLYMWWRNSSQVLSPTVGVNSAFQSLKVL